MSFTASPCHPEGAERPKGPEPDCSFGPFALLRACPEERSDEGVTSALSERIAPGVRAYLASEISAAGGREVSFIARWIGTV